jgi:hypothetical protein
VLAFFIVQDFKERLGETGTYLGRRAAEVEEAVATIVEDGDSPPSLRLGLGLVKHVGPSMV